MAKATLNGLLENDGNEICDVRFPWGASRYYGMNTGWQQGFTTGMSFPEIIFGLGPGIEYHFRAQAKNSMGIVNGQDMSFITPEPATMMVLVDELTLMGALGMA